MKIDARAARSDLLALGAACAVVCLVVPAFVVASDPGEFPLTASAFRAFAGLLFLLSFGVSAGAYLLISLAGSRRWLEPAIWGLLCWVCTVGIAMPISKSVEMVAPVNTPIAVGYLLLALLITGVATWLAATGRKTIVAIYLAVQMSVALVPLVPQIWTVFVGRGAPPVAEFVTLSARHNVLVVSFDDVSGTLALEVLREHPELAAAFADFTYFRNAVSNAPGTELSIQNELFGSRDFKAMAATAPELAKRLDLKGLALNNPRLDAAGYGPYAQFAISASRQVRQEEMGGKPDPKTAVANVVDLYDDIWVRLGTRYLAKLSQSLTVRHLNPISLVQGLLDSGCSGCDALALRMRNHKGASWDRPLLSTLRDFDALMGQVHTGNAPFALRYMHFLFTHFPVDLDDQCQYQADSQAWVDAHQNRAGAKAETLCGLRKLAALMARLKQIGAYDSSLIVLQADHGKKASYFDAPPGNLGFSGSREWGYDRYRPMLMIKPEQRKAAALDVSDRTVALSDLATTLCRRMPGPRHCDSYPGVDILAPQAASEPDFFIYIPQDAQSTHRYETLKAVRFARTQDLRALAGK